MNTRYNTQISLSAIAGSVPRPVIVSEAKQSGLRPCIPDGCQAAACAWIASCLAMTGREGGFQTDIRGAHKGAPTININH
ncbi:MAG: hypothetical protein LBJ47_08360 [Tannerella sp.]|jgi:hypothetical protein|nr:hypothetical protein [Tannerella sp.]